MKRIKLAVVRSIITEELYEVIVEDEEAAEINKVAVSGDKDALADLVGDASQKAQRRGELSTYKETGVSDKVTFVKIKMLNVKE